MNVTPVVKQLLIINVIFFIGTVLNENFAINTFALFPFDSPNFHWYQLITHMFMHGGIAHLAFNMFALYSFGSNLEHFWGGIKFVFFYISCGLGAAITYSLVNQYLTNDVASYAVGASGAIYGLLVAFGYMFPNAELGIMFIPIPIKAKYFIPGILIIDLFLGLRGQSIFGFGSTGIAHFAHIGGAITGFIMMWSWRNNKFNHNRWN